MAKIKSLNLKMGSSAIKPMTSMKPSFAKKRSGMSITMPKQTFTVSSPMKKTMKKKGMGY